MLVKWAPMCNHLFWGNICWCPRHRLNIKISSYDKRKRHCGDQRVVRSLQLRNGNFFYYKDLLGLFRQEVQFHTFSSFRHVYKQYQYQHTYQYQHLRLWLPTCCISWKYIYILNLPLFHLRPFPLPTKWVRICQMSIDNGARIST